MSKKKHTNLEFRKIKSLDCLYEVNENGTVFRNSKSKKHLAIRLDMHHSDKGYYATFVNIKGKVKRVMIHRAVAECWLGPCPEGKSVDHIDRDTRNNNYRNLRYATQSEQMKNRQLSQRVINIATQNVINHSLTVNAKQVDLIRDGQSYHFQSMTQAAYFLAEQYPNLNKPAEHFRAKMKKRYKHIYDFDIIYLNAETRHGSSTEQGIVRVA